MLYPSGENKAFMIDHNQIAELPDDDEICVKLTSQQIWALMVQCKYIGWKTRWMNKPPEFDISAFKAELETRLMCDCECFDCDDVAECIETSAPVKDVLDTHIKNYLANNGWGESPGKPLPITVSGANLAGLTNPTCNLSVLWAQCLYLVVTTNKLIEDFLQKFETLTNPVELADAAADTIPVFGDTLSAIPQMINLAQNFLTENYLADYTTTPITGYEDMLTCELFCACQGDCNITIDRFFNILLARVQTRFESAPAVLNVLSDLTSWMVGIDVSGELVADMAFLMVWGGLKLANFIVGGLTGRPTIGDGVLKMYLTIAADNPSDDWMTICSSCPSYENIIVEANPYPTSPDWLTLNADGGTFTGGDNRVVNTPHEADIVLPELRRVVTVVVIMAQSTASGSYVEIEGVGYTLERGAFIGGTTYEYTATIPNVLTDHLAFYFEPESPFTFIILSGVDSFVIEVWQL
jgi:hypothetical protein